MEERDFVSVETLRGIIYSALKGGLVNVAGSLCRQGLGLFFVMVVWRALWMGALLVFALRQLADGLLASH